jgi:hypothetical protein
MMVRDRYRFSGKRQRQIDAPRQRVERSLVRACEAYEPALVWLRGCRRDQYTANIRSRQTILPTKAEERIQQDHLSIEAAAPPASTGYAGPFTLVAAALEISGRTGRAVSQQTRHKIGHVIIDAREIWTSWNDGSVVWYCRLHGVNSFCVSVAHLRITRENYGSGHAAALIRRTVRIFPVQLGHRAGNSKDNSLTDVGHPVCGALKVVGRPQ